MKTILYNLSRMSSNDKKGIVGLTNIGNTCFGNAVLQAIRHQVDLTIFLLQGSHMKLLAKKQSTEKTRLLEAYAILVRKMWTGEGGVESTHEFWGHMIPAAILAGFDQFRIPIAHDAHEFLVFLLDQFHEAMADDVKMVIRADHSKQQTRNALEAWKRSFEKSYSPMVELIFGLQRKCITCQTCQHESVSWETMNILKASVPKQANPIHMLDILSNESANEIIEEYHCDTCSPKRTPAQISHTLWRLGNWVIVTFKRIDNHGKRINTPIIIPKTTTFSSLFHNASTEPSKTDEYDLFATINHHGSAGGGHYNAQTKHPVTGLWTFYDDERSYPLPDGPNLDASTYIVMFRRVPQGGASSASPL